MVATDLDFDFEFDQYDFEEQFAKQPREISDQLSLIVDDLHITYRVFGGEARDPNAAPSVLERVGLSRGHAAPETDVEAIRGISFAARRGESIGILGTNGSGKSTLLRAIAGVHPPTKGRVWAASEPALLGVSSALNPNLSGERNIILGGLALGLDRKQVRAQVGQVAKFAELGDFLYLPMKSYSSGMGGRLRFAISTMRVPDILMIDEALATGDSAFKKKSLRRIEQVQRNAGTLFFVSHSLASVRAICNRAIWIDQGELIMDGDVEEVANAYEAFVQNRGSAPAGARLFATAPTPPDAPLVSAPTQVYSDQNLEISWQPGGNFQRKAEVTITNSRGRTWIPKGGAITGATTELTLDSTTHPSVFGQDEIEIRVRTWGLATKGGDAGASEWSTPLTVSISAHPAPAGETATDSQTSAIPKLELDTAAATGVLAMSSSVISESDETSTAVTETPAPSSSAEAGPDAELYETAASETIPTYQAGPKFRPTQSTDQKTSSASWGWADDADPNEAVTPTPQQLNAAADFDFSDLKRVDLDNVTSDQQFEWAPWRKAEDENDVADEPEVEGIENPALAVDNPPPDADDKWTDDDALVEIDKSNWRKRSPRGLIIGAAAGAMALAASGVAVAGVINNFDAEGEIWPTASDDVAVAEAPEQPEPVLCRSRDLLLRIAPADIAIDPASAAAPTDIPRFSVGQPVYFNFEVTNVGTEDCIIDGGVGNGVYTVRHGETEVFNSTHCAAQLPGRNEVIAAGATSQTRVAWSGHRSALGQCEGAVAPVGSYTVQATLPRIGAVQSETTQIQLTRGRPTPTTPAASPAAAAPSPATPAPAPAATPTPTPTSPGEPTVPPELVPTPAPPATPTPAPPTTPDPSPTYPAPPYAPGSTYPDSAATTPPD